MSEGSQIDWAGHANNVEYMLVEFADFDATVQAAADFAAASQNTLVLVTADHSTGGLVFYVDQFELIFNFLVVSSKRKKCEIKLL